MAKKRSITSLPVIYKHSFVIWGALVLFAPLLFVRDAHELQARCLFCVAVMGSYWVFEALPLAITAFIPMILFPLFGIMRSEEVARAYLPDTCFLFMGGLMVALAVEKCELHARIALFVLKTVGSEPARVMAGFMGVTGFLSMWISNTATTALMVPIVQSVITELVSNHRMEDLVALCEAHQSSNRKHSIGMRRLSLPNENNEIKREEMDTAMSPREQRMAKGLMLSVCFSANIGGAATITGTASNLVLIGQLNELFPGADTGVNFLSWLIFAFPMVFCCLIYCWCVLYLLYLRGAPKGSIIVNRKLQQKYNELNNLSFAEISVVFCFALLLLLWILREPQVVPGWGDMFREEFVSDATSAMFIVILLFTLPEKLPNLRGRNKNEAQKASSGLLDWATVQDRFPWSVLFLLGGGFALAAGVKESGLSHDIGAIMRNLEVFNHNIIMLICIMISVSLTNVCSNTVIASIFIPIVAELARSLEIDPLNFMLPVTISASFAFLLPVATPPNAIVFSSGYLKVFDMFISGLCVTLGCVVLSMLNMLLWAGFVFNLHLFPQWAKNPSPPLDVQDWAVENNMTFVAKP
ncbi:Protein CBR-NAC-1 [Caenorhabditis briggsae]|uniref:Protein CBR-NAC-1 n=3 Tax=Caenorhabditis briggsae TaxID=6238 RepID=A0AAE9FE37_CAEBR|nr:Protein CBR-NAC-1 [Caenorhabditis briggsae]ULT84592.1 hypothetical protein L3Y34_013327 [Caenorhabditis briggsae]UMM43833.1 hypothetical protein L5515_019173 [Caenorhabditis briggsae]CAP27523.1 Protein CBR-NAC-1 [Caenorhabditis briggsae]